MSREELIRELDILKASARRASGKGHKEGREHLMRALRLNQVELEMRNRDLREAQAALEEADARYANLYDLGPVGYCTLEPTGRILEINLTASALLGVPREQLLGRTFAVVADLRERAPFLAHIWRCLATRQRVTTEIVLRPHAGRAAREIRLVSDPIHGPNGECTACRTVLVDVTDLKAMEGRLRLLADAGALLASSLSSAAVIDTAQRMLVPRIADVCLIDLVSESGSIDRAAIMFADVNKQSAFGNRIQHATPPAGWRSPQAQVIAAGEPMLLSEMPTELGTRKAGNGLDADMLRSAGARSLMVLPLSAHGRTLGALTLATAESGRLYSQADFRVAQELAGRVAVAIDNARLYDETQRMNRLLLAGAKASGIVAVSPDAIISVDERFRITLWNDGAEKIYGYSRTEAIGAPLDMLVPERYREAHRRHVERFAVGRELARRLGEAGREIVGLRKNGDEFPADTTISKLEVDGEKVLTVAVRDITDQERIESEQRTLAQLGQVVGSSLDFEETLTKVVQLVAAEFGDFALLYLSDDDHPPRRMRAASREPSSSWYAELVLTIREDARPEHPVSQAIAAKRPLLLEVTPAVLQSLAHSDEDERALALLKLRAVMAVPLITGDTCVGALLFEASSHTYGPADLRLAEEIGRRTVLLLENAKLHRRAQQAIRARDNVLRVVAHDLRNPLGTIFLETSLLAMSKRGSEGTIHESTVAIQQAANLMKRLIQDLLDTARIESGRLSVDRSRIPVAAAIGELVKGQEAVTSSAFLELRVDVMADVGDVFADHDRLQQVLWNLVSNAERFTPKGGRITIGARRLEADVLFWVSDTGAGIDAGALPHLFAAFSAKKEIEKHGTGLGLPIVKGIVEAHGGNVWAESKIGEGSTFFFTMPIAPPDPPRRRAPTRVEARSRKGKAEGDDAHDRPATAIGL